MAKRVDSPLPREDWIIGMIEYDLQKRQERHKPRMYGPNYLHTLIHDYRQDLASGCLQHNEQTSMKNHVEELEMLLSLFRSGHSFGEHDGQYRDDELLPWAVDESRKRAIVYTGRQLVIDHIGKLNRYYGQYYSNDICHTVRRKTWAYLHSMECVEGDVSAILHELITDYDVRGIDEETTGYAIEKSILIGRRIFKEILLTPRS